MLLWLIICIGCARDRYFAGLITMARVSYVDQSYVASYDFSSLSFVAASVTLPVYHHSQPLSYQHWYLHHSENEFEANVRYDRPQKYSLCQVYSWMGFLALHQFLLLTCLIRFRLLNYR